MTTLPLVVPVKLPGAVCVGRDPWWDLTITGESDGDRAERLAAAVRVCRRCPVLDRCAAHRPPGAGGVWAGRIYGAIPRARPEIAAHGPDRPDRGCGPTPPTDDTASTQDTENDDERSTPMPAPTAAPDDDGYLPLTAENFDAEIGRVRFRGPLRRDADRAHNDPDAWDRALDDEIGKNPERDDGLSPA